MITAAEHEDIRRRYLRWKEALERQYPRVAKHGGSLTAEQQSSLPPRPSNEELGAVEKYEFFHDPPEKYFLYVHEGKREAQTFTGDKLGNVVFGRSYKTNMGDTRVPIDVLGINGVQYYGTYYKSAGDYARITRKKTRKR